MKDVVLSFENEALLFGLLDLDISAHRQVDDRRCDVPRMNGVINKRSSFSGAHVGRRFIHRGNGHAWIWVSTLVPPERKHNGESDELSLIHISEPTRLLSISYAVF